MITAKNSLIKQHAKETKARHRKMTCRVYELKVNRSKLNKKTKDQFRQMFLEAKWLYNYVLEDVKTRTNKAGVCKLKEIPVTFKDKIEIKQLSGLSSQMKQAVIDSVGDDIHALAEAKKKGNKVGWIQPKHVCNSIDLRQYGNTYQILDKTHIHIQGIKQKLRVRGLGKISKDCEIANAKLIRKGLDIYLHITTYNNPDPLAYIGTSIGADMGISTQFSLSNGMKIEYGTPTMRVRKAHKSLSHKQKGSNNHKKANRHLNKEYEDDNRRKKDIRHRVVSFLTKYEHLCIQDENIKGWKNGWYGRQIQRSAIGGIAAELEHGSGTLVADRFFPSTKLCPQCGSLNHHTLDQRTYSCSCGYSYDRDIHAARNIERECLKKLGLVPTEHREVTTVEMDTSARIMGVCPYIRVSTVAETGSPRLKAGVVHQIDNLLLQDS